MVMGAKKQNLASIGVTTTGAEILTISALTVATDKTVTVNWGDGSSDTYSGAGARTHNYAGAGVWKVKFSNQQNITVFNCSDNKVTLNSKDVKGMINVTDFRINGLKAGRFDSSDVSAWRPTTFSLYSMPAGYSGTFNSSDVSAWRPTNFYLHSMPTGYAGTFNSTDVSAWRPTTFYLYSMPVATFTITITANGFAGWITTTNFQMQNNSLSQTQVVQILADFWAGFATRTGAAGTINVGTNNAAPGGTYQAANPPTTGLEFRYELLNDSQNINPTKKWATVTVAS